MAHSNTPPHVYVTMWKYLLKVWFQVKVYQQLLWQVELPQLVKEVQPLLGLFHNGVYVIVPLQVLGDDGAQEPEWLHWSHSAIHDGKWGESRGVAPEFHDHLHYFERVQLQVVKTAPDSQLLNLLSVSRLVSALDEADQWGVICKLQELDRRVFRCAVVRILGEEQWGENIALRSSSFFPCFFKSAIELIQIVCLLLILHSAGGWCLVNGDVFHTFPHWNRITGRESDP